MPGEDGYSLVRKVRTMTKNRPKGLPAAALTAYARMEDRARAMLAGFQSHIAKPVDPDELLIVVATLAGRTE
jgi:CheY-like chemotaxis protein